MDKATYTKEFRAVRAWLENIYEAEIATTRSMIDHFYSTNKNKFKGSFDTVALHISITLDHLKLYFTSGRCKIR